MAKTPTKKEPYKDLGKTIAFTSAEVDDLIFALCRASGTIEAGKPLRERLVDLAARVDRHPKNKE